MKRKVYGTVIITLAGVLSAISAVGAVVPNGLFTDGAVLQQGMDVPVWGTAREGEKVTVSFQNQVVSTRAAGRDWMVRLKPLKPGGPFEMTIAGEDSTIKLHNILVGEVWVCSGQSNMQWPVIWSAESEEAISGCADPKLHLLGMPLATAKRPRKVIQKGHISVYPAKVGDPTTDDAPRYPKWQESGPGVTPSFSAVGYFFGKYLRRELDVPVGLINTSWGGTIVEAWTSRSVLRSNPENKPFLAKPLASPNQPSAVYNGVLSPMLPYAIRGVIWYQGESNAYRAWAYRRSFPEMVENWRDVWGQGEFPFLFVQIAPWNKSAPEPGESEWAELREAQLLASRRVPNSAMAVITDCGDHADVHPRRKKLVGYRLYLAALAKVYGRKLVFSGPIFKSMKVEGDKAVISFDHVGGGLVAKGGRLTGFAVAGEDRKFVYADAAIKGDKVIVSSPKVRKPIAVRFGWADYPDVNLYNKEDLPASPFRTDDFPMLSSLNK